MTPAQKIKREILLLATPYRHLDPFDTPEQVERAYDKLRDLDAQWDYESEFRQGQYETGLPCPGSRHYESRAVARQLSDGTWIGWVYWFGGGKHGEPERVEWMEDAYFLSVTEEEKVVRVRTFTKVP